MWRAAGASRRFAGKQKPSAFRFGGTVVGKLTLLAAIDRSPLQHSSIELPSLLPMTSVGYR